MLRERRQEAAYAVVTENRTGSSSVARFEVDLQVGWPVLSLVHLPFLKVEIGVLLSFHWLP